MKRIITSKHSWIFCAILLLGLHVSGYAQHTVSGTVTDANTSETIPGVNIRVQGTSIGTISNADGSYELTAQADSDTLIFSYVGYQTQTVSINGRSEINITLQEQTFTGEELVVVGYGTQRAEEVTSAVSSVSEEEFTKSSPKDAASLIKAKVPGLTVNSSTGDPTSGSSISLRGTTSIEAPTDPLVLIDGVPGALNTVPPEEIKSIDVLKSGSAAAIYGSRGSNGVLLITTKNRNSDAPTRIEYDGYVNVQQIAKEPNMLDAEGVRQYQNDYGNLEDLGYNTDWIDVITRTPVSQRHNLTFSGGNRLTNYTASLNYQNTQGIFLNSDNEVITGRVNVRHSMFDDRLTANVNTIVRSQNYFTGADGGSFNTFAYRNALTRNPTDRARDDEGNYIYRSGFEYENPLVLLEEVNGENKNRELRLNGTLSFDPVEQLNFQLLGSYNEWSQTRGYAETFKHVSAVEGGNEGYASRGTGASSDKLMELTGTYSDDFGDHSVTLLGGYSWQEVISEDYFMQNYNFPTDAYSYNSIGNGDALPEGEATMSSEKNSYNLIGFFSRLNYNFDNRYLLMGSLRYEGNSKFGADNKWGVFPAVSAGWRVSQEAFMNGVDFISDLKLRAGYGVTGIAPTDAYQSLPSLNYGDRIYNNGEWVQGISPARNANPNLRWERKVEVNIGMDIALFNDRFSGTVDVYRRTTNDMLYNYDVPVPPNVFPSILANVGKMRNEGIEVGLEYQILQNKSLIWNTTVTGSTNRNKLVTLSNELYETTNDFFYPDAFTGAPIQLPTHRIDIGGPIGNFYGYKSVDISDEGQWIVLNADGEEVPLDQASLDDRYVLGNGIPDYNLGWNHSLGYKNFDLNITMRGAFGHQILNFQRMFYENPNLAPENVLATAFDDVYGKRPLDTGLAYVSYYIEDGDYWKIDNVTLGYTFDVGALNYIQNARLYVSGDNLVTITGYSGMDPEVDTSGLGPGNDSRDKYPTTRTFTIGVNLTF